MTYVTSYSESRSGACYINTDDGKQYSANSTSGYPTSST